MRAVDLLVEFYEPSDDKLSNEELSDTRRPRLTLRHLNKLRKMRDMQAIERQERSEFVKTMYGDAGAVAPTSAPAEF